MKLHTTLKTALLASLLVSAFCQADAASGLATGKRQHKPVLIAKPIDKATPILAKTLSASVKSSSALGNNRSAYRLCPDGTMINPGEKCPEKKARK